MRAVETACADHWAARLARSQGAAEIEALCAECAGNEGLMNMVYQLMDSDDSCTATNALWLLNHLPKSEDAWLETHRADLIARTLSLIHISEPTRPAQLLCRPRPAATRDGCLPCPVCQTGL